MPSSTGNNPQILVVSGDVGAAAVTVRQLGLSGYSVVPCHSGTEMLSALKNQALDLVLLDADLPDMDSLELLRQIRKHHGTAELPVILMMPDQYRLHILAAIDAGANDFVTAPIDFELLAARIALQMNLRAEVRHVVTEQARLRRRLELRAQLEDSGYGDPKQRRFLMDELHRDVIGGNVGVVYQPQYRIRAGVIDAAEALMRWNSPTLGPVSPQKFISLAEETGDIAQLTEWVLVRVLEDHARLVEAGHAIRIAVNLSATLAGDTVFADRVLDILSARPNAVSLELTESAIFDNPDAVIANLRRFADAGVRSSIDDYGTGMSSMSYIQKLPVQELKIDRSFVSRLTSSQRDPLLVRSTIELAHALEFEVVAEGIEDAETLALLSIMGCDLAQGYFIGAPMKFAEFVEFLEDTPRLKRLIAPFDAQMFLDSEF